MTKENEKNLEIEKYEIDKKFEIQQKKLDEASNIVVGNLNLGAISLMADKFAKAGDMIPREFQGNPQKCFVAIYKGASLGLDAFTALQRISVINGRATIWGDTALALVKKSGLLVSFKEEIIENDKMIAVCTVQRKGEEEHISKFSQDDAITAGLWGKNVWKSYPKRMLKYRARAYALRDVFPDVLDGLYLKEEMEETEPKFIGETIQTNNEDVISQDQEIEIRNILTAAEISDTDFCRIYKINSITDLLASKFEVAKQSLVAKASQVVAKKEEVKDDRV
jgi:hypothetical protein